MTVTDADRIMSPGAVITLTDGRQVPLRFGYRGLYKLEKHFGSVKQVFDGLAQGMEGQFFASLLPGISIASGLTLDEVFDLLDPQDASKHMEAFGVALTQAFPREAQEAATATTASEPSPGPTTSTSPQSDWAALSTSSTT